MPRGIFGAYSELLLLLRAKAVYATPQQEQQHQQRTRSATGSTRARDDFTEESPTPRCTTLPHRPRVPFPSRGRPTDPQTTLPGAQKGNSRAAWTSSGRRVRWTLRRRAAEGTRRRAVVAVPCR
ncbi:unnamed protein product [Lampetra fluviatilis]